jgi:TRAP-type uncharacterized transport system substrate-binding protein
MKLTLLFRKRWLWLYSPLVLISGLLLWLSVTRWLPMPPTSIVMAGALPTGSYIATVLRYRDVLERKGILVEAITTESAAAPLQKLQDSTSKVDAGLAQGLLSKPNIDGVLALAAIERSPVWIFTRVPSIDQLEQFRGFRIATPKTGNSGWEITQLLLEHAKLSAADVRMIATESHAETAAALIEDRADVAVIVAGGNDESVRRLNLAQGIHLVSVERIASLVVREPRLKAFVLPQGAIELRGNIPANDVTMVGPDLQLLVRSSLHPALQRELIDASKEIHEIAGFLQRQGEFPHTFELDFALSEVAASMANGERPWIENILPYWWAQLAQLLIYAVIPILLLSYFVMSWIPRLFNWKVNAILQDFYGELKFLEADIEPVASTRPIEIKNLLQRLDDIEAKVRLLDLPNSYANRWYTLREHLARAREKLLNMRAR